MDFNTYKLTEIFEEEKLTEEQKIELNGYIARGFTYSVAMEKVKNKYFGEKADAINYYKSKIYKQSIEQGMTHEEARDFVWRMFRGD